jgi:hypothetical protein
VRLGQRRKHGTGTRKAWIRRGCVYIGHWSLLQSCS